MTKIRKKRSLKWMLWQLLPMTYVSRFGGKNDRKICTWKMWMGRCYKVQFNQLAD